MKILENALGILWCNSQDEVGKELLPALATLSQTVTSWIQVYVGILGVIAATMVGGVAVWVAVRSNQLTKETASFAREVRLNDEAREERERTRQARIERIELAAEVRAWINQRLQERATFGLAGGPDSREQRTRLGDYVAGSGESDLYDLLEQVDGILNQQTPPGSDPSRLHRLTRITPQLLESAISTYIRGGRQMQI